jgi:hypothetical protein
MSRQYHAPSHTATQKKAPQFTAPSVVRPTVQKKSAAKSLPQWNPAGPTVDPLARLSQAPAIQAKLTVGAANNKYEQEADRVAHDVVQRINSPTAETPQAETVQRETEDEDLQTKPLLQRKTAADGGAVSTELESSIKKAKGGGQSLDTGLQAKMGQAMGADFSGVKVHTDSQSDQLNQSIQARAFTTGSDVFFRKGEYNPSNKGGQELIAHELTHVVQQGSASIAQTQVQTQRERSGAITEAPDLSFLKQPVAKLNICVDLDAPDMALPKQLLSGEVGHAWVSLEWNDPSHVPDYLPEAHQKQLKKGEDPFGFWPLKFDWLDYSGMSSDEIFNQLLIDNVDSYNEMAACLQEDYPDITIDEIRDAVTEQIESDVDIATKWGGFHIDSEHAVGYSSNPFESYVPGQVVHPDYMHSAKAKQTYDVTIGEVTKVLDYAESKQNAQYSVFFYNCTTFAKEAVQAAGKPAPKAGTAKVFYPDKLYKSIKSNYEKGKGHTFLEIKDEMKEKVGPSLQEKSKKKKK